MRQIAAGEFKQTCLRLLDEVRETGEAIVITKHGVPVARLGPLQQREDWRGAMRGTAEMTDDLIAPAAEPEEWEALQA